MNKNNEIEMILQNYNKTFDKKQFKKITTKNQSSIQIKITKKKNDIKELIKIIKTIYLFEYE